MTQLLPFAFMMLLGVVVFFRSRRKVTARRVSLEADARARGWQWQQGDRALLHQFNITPLYGTDGAVKNVVRGVHDGRSFVAFDYSTLLGSGDTASTEHFSVVAVLLGTGWPQLLVQRARGLGARAVGRTVGKPVTFDDRDFDSEYQVNCADPAFAHWLLTPLVRAHLQGPEAGSFRLDRGSLVRVAKGHASAEYIASTVTSLSDLARRFPAAS